MINKFLDKINKLVPQKWQWILSHEGFRKYFKNTGWMFVGRIAGLFFSFFAIAFVARNLGPENYGQLSYVVSFVGLFGFIASLGIENILYRELIINPNKQYLYLGSAFVIRLLASFLAILILTAFTFILNIDKQSQLLILFLSISFVFNSFHVVAFSFQANVQSKYLAISSIAVSAILNILKIIAALYFYSLFYFILILLFESILYIIFYFYFYNRVLKSKLSFWRFDKIIAIKIIKDSLPMMLSSVFIIIYSRIDQVFIGNMIDMSSVGIYDAAVKISELWYFIPGIIVSSLFPAIVNSKRFNNINYFFRLKKLFYFLFFLSIFIAIFVTIFSSNIINLVYGKDFSESIIILKIYVWAGIGVFVGVLIDNYLITENFRKILIIKSLIPMLINIVLNILLIPRIGIAGAAYATLIAYILAPFVLLFFQKTRNDLIKMIYNKVK